jgi:hypothetical protein
MSLREAERSERRRSHQRKTETKAEREQRLAQEKAERLALRQSFATDDDLVLSLKEWAALNGISTRQARRIIAAGSGPIVTRISQHRIGVTRRHDREWKASRVRGGK